MPERIERDTVANLEGAGSRTDFDYLAGGFVAEHEREARNHAIRAKLPIDDVQVGAAHSTRADSNQQFALARPGRGRVDHLGAGCGPSLGDCFHLWRPLPSSQYDSFQLTCNFFS
jgi:hypothetical protein